MSRLAQYRTSQRKGDLTVSELRADGLPTIADVGIAHPLNDTYLTKQSTEERAFAANKYGSKKDKAYNGTIKAKDLPYGYMSLTFGTFGSFGELGQSPEASIEIGIARSSVSVPASAQGSGVFRHLGRISRDSILPWPSWILSESAGSKMPKSAEILLKNGGQRA